MKIVSKILKWILGIVVSLMLITFLVLPSIFTKGRTYYSEYVDFNDPYNFDTKSVDLYRTVSSSSYIIVADPLLEYEDNGVSFVIYLVEDFNSESKWPYSYMIEIENRTLSKHEIYCAVAIQEDRVIGKECGTLIFDIDQIELFSNNTIGMTLENGTSILVFTLVNLNDSAQFEWTTDTAEHLKRKYRNDLDYFLYGEYLFVEN